MIQNKDIRNSYGFKNDQQNDEHVTKQKKERKICFGGGGILRSVEC